MGLASLVCHIYRDNKVIEHRIACLRQHHRRGHRKATIVASCQLALCHQFVFQIASNNTLIPIIRVTHPPECASTLHLIFHGSSLHRDTSIRTGRALHLQCIAIGIINSHLGNIHLKCRTLVFLYAEETSISININHILPRQGLARQCKLGGARTEIISNQFLLLHYFMVCVTKFHLQFLTL